MPAGTQQFCCFFSTLASAEEFIKDLNGLCSVAIGDIGYNINLHLYALLIDRCGEDDGDFTVVLVCILAEVSGAYSLNLIKRFRNQLWVVKPDVRRIAAFKRRLEDVEIREMDHRIPKLFVLCLDFVIQNISDGVADKHGVVVLII